MRFALISKGLWKHVTNDGEVTDTDGDQKALALIGLSVMDHHLPSLVQRGDGESRVGRAGGCCTRRRAWRAAWRSSAR